MKPTLSSLRPITRAAWIGCRKAATVLTGAALLGTAFQAAAVTALSDVPVFSQINVPGNLALALSVEWPTAVRTAHTSTTYDATATYLGYFDPNKCYTYHYVASETPSDLSYFQPAGLNAARNCSNANEWSGNYLNWAATPTIDPFRWAMTGGYRVIDTTTLTVLQKAWHSGQGNLTPDKSMTVAADIAGATPFASSTGLYSRIQGLGIKMRFTALMANNDFKGDYYNGTSLSGGVQNSRTDKQIDFAWTGKPISSVNSDNFSVRWTAKHIAPATGSYNFRTISKNGVRLYIDGNLIIDNWTDHSSTTDTSATVNFTQGQSYDIQIEYYDTTGTSDIELTWLPPGAAAYMQYSNPLTNGPFTAYDPSATISNVAVYEVNMRDRVCDPSVVAGGVEANCKEYSPTNWKPEGLVQKYSKKLRYSAFGYLNDSNMLRDGAVLRAQQTFVGPMRPVPGGVDVANSAAEWDPTTGIYLTNPDAADATQTTADFAPSVAVANSGVMNYLNKFGQLMPGNYKSYDPVSELYYTALRYLKNQGSVPAYSAMDMSAAAAATRTTFLDGFPAITNWKDPIQYSCQRNFILGIGDIYTHRDKDLPGSTGTTEEPSRPPEVSGDTTVNAETFTNKVFALQGLSAPNPDNYSGRNNSAGIAGLAYYANTNDIRPDDAAVPATTGKQTVQTYWVDVLEQPFVENNQFYLAAKYGGFTVPDSFDALSAAALPALDSWSTTGDMVGTQNRPDNYFTAGRPDTMVAGLTKAFEKIVSALDAYTTSFSTSVPQVATSGNGSYSAMYNPEDWTGEITASELSFNVDGDPTLTPKWAATAKLAAQLGGTGWDTDRRVVTWNGSAGVPFRHANLTSAQQAALNTPYGDATYAATDDSANYLNYLRGDRSQEQDSAVSGSSKAYRTRAKLLGDIVGSRARPVGPPSLPLSDATNPGYSAFKNTWKDRATVVYAGANDGMLHAFNGSITDATAGGKEIFAYVPSALFAGPDGVPTLSGLASLGRSPMIHHHMVNATPTVFDIDLGKTWTGTGVGTTVDWHSVLIGGLGKGGRSYYAIDVTDPSAFADEATAAGKVLWEFTAPNMGYTFGEPVVVKTHKYGWVVALPSGYNTPDGQGYLYIVNPRTGELLETLSTGVGSVANDAGLANANAYVTDYTDGYADAIYAGDLLGNLWRFDVTATAAAAKFSDTAPVKLAYFDHGVDGPQPITSRPIIEIHPKTKKRYVMVGTGRLLSDTDITSTKEQSFYAIQDGDAVKFGTTLPTGVDYPIERDELTANTSLTTGITPAADKMGWYVDLGKDAATGVAWRIVTDPATYYGTAAFAPTLPNITDPCSPSGTSRVYATDFSIGVTKLFDTTGALTGYSAVTTGVITDLHFLSVGGKVRLIGGSDRGEVKRQPGTFDSVVGLKRLNWREVPAAN